MDSGELPCLRTATDDNLPSHRNPTDFHATRRYSNRENTAKVGVQTEVIFQSGDTPMLYTSGFHMPISIDASTGMSDCC